MTQTQTKAWGRRLAPGILEGIEPRTVLEMVNDVMSLAITRTWTKPEVLTAKTTWTAEEVVELVVELFDGDDLNEEDKG